MDLLQTGREMPGAGPELPGLPDAGAALPEEKEEAVKSDYMAV